MSEVINKLLCDRQQSFTTAEQKIGRDNIGAMAASASASFQPVFGMSAYVPFSAISADANSAITSINGSSVGGGITSVSAENGLTGDGSTGTPLGLDSAFQLRCGTGTAYFSPDGVSVSGAGSRVYVYQNASSYCDLHRSGLYVMHTASGVGGSSTYTYYGETPSIHYNAGDYYLHHINAGSSGWQITYNGQPGWSATYGHRNATFTDNSGTTTEYVDASSIQRWNSYSSLANPSSFLYTGSYQSASGQATGFNFWDNASGSSFIKSTSISIERPNISATSQLLANGLQLREDGQTTEMVDRSSVYSWNHPQFFVKVYDTDLTADDNDHVNDWYPTGLTSDACFVHVNNSTQYKVWLELDNSQGYTANLEPGDIFKCYYCAATNHWIFGETGKVQN